MIAFAAAAVACLAPQAPARFAGVPAQDARQYDIDLRVDLAAKQLTGHVDYLFTATEELRTIRLDALRSDDWHVTFRDAEGRELAAEWGEAHAIVTLPAVAAKGADVRFRAELRGKPVDGFYFKENRYGDLMAFTDHYSIRARGWLPCEDHPGDRAKFSARIAYPEGNEIVGFGVPEESAAASPDLPAGYREVRLAGRSEIPPYMFALVIGPLARVTEPGDPRLVDHLVYRQDLDKAKAALVHHAEWLATMERTFGPYPYGKYTTVQCPTRWGGFEAPGNVQLAERLFDGRDRGQGTLAHELVHMWFGDAVGYSEWREVWLSEGFASYFGPWLHARTGGAELPQRMQQLRARWRKSFEGRTKTIRDDGFAHPDRALNSNTYPKGAWVLHMLRGEIGDEAFFGALKAYVEQCRGRSVVTADFVACIEQHTKTELSWFFDQWLDRVGCPELRATVTDDAIVVEQVQKGDPYRFWLRVAWQNAEGKPVSERIRVDAATARVKLTGPASNVQLDPKTELLFRAVR